MQDFITLDKTSGTGTEYVNVTVSPNPTPEERTGEVVFKVGDTTETLSILQEASPIVVVIPEFDYLVLRYSWGDDDGKDFDTDTEFVNTGLPGVDGILVGWSKNMQATQWQVKDYLLHGGDNMQSGREAVCIYMNNLLSPENLAVLPQEIKLDAYGNWYENRIKGNVTISFTAYKGGEMIKNKTDFININGEEVYNGSETINVSAVGKDNNLQPRIRYTKMATMYYNKTTRDSYIQVYGA